MPHKGMKTKFQEIKVDYIDGFYTVLYLDENGMSHLAKTKDRLKAFELAKKYKKDVEKGVLLRPKEKGKDSIWK